MRQFLLKVHFVIHSEKESLGSFLPVSTSAQYSAVETTRSIALATTLAFTRLACSASQSMAVALEQP
ncbi:MAG: hypothetical protein HZA95_01840 [Candidatus Vogelbacteria bacterium]|nr:hypothetical protein [Candidatus Vogelbacteria bacterium]